MKTFALRALAAATLCAVAVPTFAQAQMPPLEAYGALPEIEEAALSESGAYTAMLMTVGNDRQIVVLDRAGTPVTRFIVGDAKVRGIDWVGDEAILLRRSETERVSRRYGGSKVEWMRANVIPLAQGRDVVSVFADQNYIANATLGFYGIRRVAGEWLGYFGGFRMGKSSGENPRILHYRPALYAVNLITGKTDQIAFPAGENGFRDWLIGDEGSVEAVLDVDTRSGAFTIDNGDGQTLVRGEEPDGRINLKGFDASGEAVIYSVFDRAAGETRYFRVPLAGGTASPIWEDTRVHRINYGRNSRILGIITTKGDVLMEDRGKQNALGKVYDLYPNSEVSLFGWTSDLSSIVFRTSGNYDSGSWFRMDTASGDRAMLGLERSFIQGPAIGKIETLTYKAGDGLEIEAILTLPPGREPADLPVIVLPHGGPTSHDDAEFDWWAQAFASRGYAVLQPNFRGSTNRDEAFVAAGDGEWGRKMQTDLSDGLRALDERGIVDADRACIVGASYGGYAALAGVTLQNDIYRCAVGVNGVYDLEVMFRDYFTGRSDIFQRGAERLLGEDADRGALSPTENAARADAPVLLIHGKDDTVVPYAQAVMMEDRLKDAGKPVRLVTLEGEDHWLSQADTRTAMLREAIAFVEEHNPAD